MSEPLRVTPQEVYQKLKLAELLLVCAYDDEEKFRMMRLEGAISLKEFRSRLPEISKNQEIVFYCA
ncbi:MAG: ArsR family transcriptional regulator [Pseudomonadota bacterium]